MAAPTVLETSLQKFIKHGPILREIQRGMTDLCLALEIKNVNGGGPPRVIRLVPHVDKAPLPLRILRLVTSNFLPVENPTHPTAHAPERASVYILGQFRTSK